MLDGWDRSFDTLGDLRLALQGCSLRAGDDCFPLHHCCLPRPRGEWEDERHWVGMTLCSEASPRGQCPLLCLEISNLVIMRGSRAHTQPLNLSQLSFHRVHQDEITQVGVLWQGMQAWRCGGHLLSSATHTAFSTTSYSSPIWAKAQEPMYMRAC